MMSKQQQQQLMQPPKEREVQLNSRESTSRFRVQYDIRKTSITNSGADSVSSARNVIDGDIESHNASDLDRNSSSGDSSTNSWRLSIAPIDESFRVDELTRRRSSHASSRHSPDDDSDDDVKYIFGESQNSPRCDSVYSRHGSMNSIFSDSSSIVNHRPTPPVRKKSLNLNPLTYKSMSMQSMRIDDREGSSSSNSLSTYYNTRLNSRTKNSCSTNDCRGEYDTREASLHIEDLEEIWNKRTHKYPSKNASPSTPRTSKHGGSRDIHSVATTISDESLSASSTETTICTESSDQFGSFGSLASIQQWFKYGNSSNTKRCYANGYYQYLQSQKIRRHRRNEKRLSYDMPFLCWNRKQRTMVSLTVLCVLSWSSFLGMTVYNQSQIMQVFSDVSMSMTDTSQTSRRLGKQEQNDPNGYPAFESVNASADEHHLYLNDGRPMTKLVKIQRMNHRKPVIKSSENRFDPIASNGIREDEIDGLERSIESELLEGNQKSDDYMGGFHYEELIPKVVRKGKNVTKTMKESTSYETRRKARNIAVLETLNRL